MNLLFNAESLRPPLTGVGNYTFHLLEQFVRGSLVDDVHCFSGTDWREGATQLQVTRDLQAAGGQGSSGPRARAVASVREAIGAIPGTKALYSAIMDRRFEKGANNVPDAIYHETNYILKPYKGPSVTTVHDLSHIRYPQFHPAHVIRWLDEALPRTLERAGRIITVSDVVRRELIELFDLPEERVCTVYEGVDGRYIPRDESTISQVLADFGLGYKGYVLMVATLEPRKGIDVLLEAWSQLPLDLRREYPLVLAGSVGWRNEDVMRRIQQLTAEGTVRHLGYVHGDLLPALFSGAAVFSYPSVYEGFGLPVLDAMSSAVPVICRAGTSMAEFSEGSCVLCETGEAAELALRIQGLLTDTQERERWGQRGLAQAAKFTWERCAAETAAIYRQIS